MKAHTTAIKLAEFIVAKTPARRRSIVREARKPLSGHAPWYTAFGSPAREFLLGDSLDPQVILRAIARLKTRTGRPWHAIDSRITTEAFKKLLALRPRLHPRATFVRVPSRHQSRLTIADLEISIRPDLLVHGERNGKPLIGALKFFLPKTPQHQIGHRGAELAATMLHLLLTSTATGERAPDAGLCLVVELFRGYVTPAPSDIDAMIPVIERGAREFVEMWHTFDTKEAA